MGYQLPLLFIYIGIGIAAIVSIAFGYKLATTQTPTRAFFGGTFFVGGGIAITSYITCFALAGEKVANYWLYPIAFLGIFLGALLSLGLMSPHFELNKNKKLQD